MWQKIWTFIKQIPKKVWSAIGVAIGFIVVLICTRKNRRPIEDDRLGTSSSDDGREREIDRLDSRAERTVDLEQGIIEECREELEATREYIESAEDSVGRLQDRSELVESVAEEIKRRAQQKKDH